MPVASRPLPNCRSLVCGVVDNDVGVCGPTQPARPLVCGDAVVGVRKDPSPSLGQTGATGFDPCMHIWDDIDSIFKALSLNWRAKALVVSTGAAGSLKDRSLICLANTSDEGTGGLVKRPPSPQGLTTKVAGEPARTTRELALFWRDNTGTPPTAAPLQPAMGPARNTGAARMCFQAACPCTLR